MSTCPDFSPRSYVGNGRFSWAAKSPDTTPPMSPGFSAFSSRSPVLMLYVALQKSQDNLGKLFPVSSLGGQTFAFASGALHDTQDDEKQ